MRRPIRSPHRAPQRRALFTALACVLAAAPAAAQAPPSAWSARPQAPGGGPPAVTHCGDDGSGSLRAAVAAAGNADTIDLSALDCGTIALSGALAVSVDDLELIGPGADRLALDAGGLDRVLAHSGQGTLTIRGLAIRGGTVVGKSAGDPLRGGCVVSAGRLDLRESSVSGCLADAVDRAYGGCISAQQAVIADAVIEHCTARASDAEQGWVHGGALAVDDGLQMERSRVSHSTARATQGEALGGGIFLGSTPSTIVDSFIHDNAAVGAPYLAGPGFTTVQGMGGGIHTAGRLALSGCTVAGNSASSGGGISLNEAGFSEDALSLVNSTVSGNTASSQGGGIWVLFSGIRIDNSTVVHNEAVLGAGGIMPRLGLFALYDQSYPPKISSSIVAANATEKGAADLFIDTFGSPAPKAFAVVGAQDLIGDSNLPLPAGTLGGDPRLAPLADNGGSSPTHALLADSPARDAGSNTLNLPFDQRGAGHPRSAGAAPDIGAFESQSASETIFADGFE